MKRILCLLLFIHLVGCDYFRTDEDYLAEARASMAVGNIPAAVIQTKNALEKNPENSAARLLMAELNLLTGDPLAAEKEIGHAIRLNAARDGYIPILSQTYLALDKHEQLFELSTEDLSYDGKSRLLATQGVAYILEGDLEKAEEVILLAKTNNPQSINAWLAHARLFIARDQREDARRALSKVIELNDQEPLAWAVLGELEQRDGHTEEAITAFSQAIESGANTHTFRLKRAELLIETKKFDEAEKDVAVLMKSMPDDPGVNFAQAQILLARGQAEEALPFLEKAAHAQADRHTQALYALALINFQLKNYEQAETYAYRFVDDVPGSLSGRKVLATILLQNGKLDDAKAELQRIIVAKPDEVDALNLLATIMYRQGEKAESVDILENIANKHPDSAYNQLRLGTGLLFKGETEGGRQAIEKAVSLDPELNDAAIALILFNIGQKEFSQALSLAKTYVENNPESTLAYNLLGSIYAQTGNRKLAREAFKQALVLRPADRLANNSLAVMAVNEKKFDQARARYKAILKQNPADLTSLMRLASLDAFQNQKESMIAHLKQAIELNPGALKPRIVMARYFLEEDHPERVAALFLGLEKQVKSNADALFVLAKAQLLQENYAEAQFWLISLVSVKPDSPTAHYLLARAYAGSGNDKRMLESLAKALRLKPEQVEARATLVAYLVEANPAEAAVELQKLEKQAPDYHLIPKFKKALDYRLADSDELLEKFEEAYKAEPTRINLYRLVDQSIKVDDRERAASLIEDWLVKEPKDVGARLLLAYQYVALEKPQEDIANQYEKILTLQPGHLVALNNLAWLLQSSNPSKAVEYAKKANELKPASAPLLDTLAVALLANGELDKARDAVKQALLLSSGNPSIRFHAARIDLAQGDDLSAFDRLNELLQDESEFPERQEAEALLKQLRTD